MVILTFTIITFLLTLGLIYIIYRYYKISKSDIIRIEDIDMLVEYKRRRKKLVNGVYKYEYLVRLVSLENNNKKLYFNSKRSYYKYSEGDIVKMQEIVYKYKDNIFSDIVFAKEEHYKKLEKFKNTQTNSENISNDIIDSNINSQHIKTNNILKFIPIILVPIMIFIFIYMQIDGYKARKKYGYTETISIGSSVGNVHVVNKVSEKYVEGTDSISKEIENTIKELPRSNRIEEDQESIILDLDIIKTNKKNYGIYAIKENDIYKYKVNGELKQFKHEYIPENLEINYNQYAPKSQIVIKKSIIKTYDDIDNNEFMSLTNEEIQQRTPTSIEEKNYYILNLKSPTEIEHIDSTNESDISLIKLLISFLIN